MMNTGGNLVGKLAVVTGGASGIGRAIAEEAARAGARVIVADRAAGAARDAAEAIAGARPCELDVTRSESVTAAAEAILAEHGAVDVLFNCAAIWEMEPFLDTSEGSFDRLFDVNVKGLYFTQQAFARGMVERGTRGCIVNIASQAGRRGECASPVYAATKACVISITQSAALALVGHGIRVNAIAPGCVDTPMWQKVDAAFAERDGIAPGEKTRQVLNGIPMGRLADPADVASVAVFLASDRAGYVTGQTLNVDGGSFLS